LKNNFRNRGDKETDLGWELVVERSEFRPECTDSCGLWDDEQTIRNILQIQDELNLWQKVRLSVKRVYRADILERDNNVRVIAGSGL